MAKKKETKETPERPKFEEKPPIFERKISTSKDGQWLIIKTIRTDILRTKYMAAVINKGEN